MVEHEGEKVVHSSLLEASHAGRPPLNLAGQRFGRLTVLSFAGKEGGKRSWNCQCDCGNTAVVSQRLLRAGKTRSCGCLRVAQVAKNAGRVDGSSTILVERFRAKPSRANSSGCSGVYLNKRTGKWSAQITFRGKTRYLGSYESKGDAIAARRRAESIFDEYLAEVRAHHANAHDAASDSAPVQLAPSETVGQPLECVK